MLRVAAHPLRLELLKILNDKEASPSDLASELKLPLGNVSYHMRQLHANQAIELTRTAKRRGATEHYYRAAMVPFLSDDDFRALPPSARRSIFGGLLRDIIKHLRTADRGHAFDNPESHVSWTRFELDEEGFAEMTALLAEALDRSQAIGVAARDRLGRGQADYSTELAILHFERREPPTT